jgi:hypothetical protein
VQQLTPTRGRFDAIKNPLELHHLEIAPPLDVARPPDTLSIYLEYVQRKILGALAWVLRRRDSSVVKNGRGF